VTILPALSDMFDLTGRHALVVGAGSGIGRVSCAGLAAFGAQVTCADVELETAGQTAAEVIEAGGVAHAVRLDLTDDESIAAAASDLDAVDVLVSTPAINVRKPLLSLTDAEFDRVVDLNLKGNFRLIRAFAGGMARRGHGSIVGFSSVRAEVVEPGQGVYAATKAGMLQMFRALAAELGPYGVRVNAVAPGVVETPLTAQIKADARWYQAYAEKSVFGRWAVPSELVGAVVFLASDASSYVTGTHLMVDGGWTAADGRFAPPLPAEAVT
jgi:NAD(P)-dependent dehydrogenase (short-subunit alcohol dehydrogenase family)